MPENLAEPETGAKNQPGTTERGIRRVLASRATRRNISEAKAAELIEQAQRADESIRKREEAEAIGRARVVRGQGADIVDELAAEYAEQTAAEPAPSSHPSHGAAKRKQCAREARKLRERFIRRHMRDVEREMADAEALSLAMLAKHGIRHHFRPLVKLAFFVSYMAGLDKNGALAFRALHSINMPPARVAAVLDAAYNPQPHQPRRDVCLGKRKDQTPFKLAPGAELARREENHPAAIAAIQCAIFAWLSRTRTPRRGFAYVLRGFGRGVFCSVAQRGVDAINGHNDGTPGALVALGASGFFHHYNPPPAQLCSPLDRGPSGYAYNAFWFRSSAEELALDELHTELAQLGRLPLIARLMEDPEMLDGMLEARAPPSAEPIDPALIPF